MPKLPKEFLDKLDSDRNLTPDVHGEEGRVYFIGDMTIKRWYGNHRVCGGLEKSEVNPNSPFKAKFEYYKHKLGHRVFPEIVNIEVGFDERLSVRDLDLCPVTITKRIDNANCEVAKVRNSIIEEYYKGKFMENTINDQSLDYLSKIDKKMMELLGCGIIERRGWEGQDITTDYINQYPDSLVSELYRAGLEPIHFEWNYLPTSDDKGHFQEKKGVLLEFSIEDMSKYRSYVEAKLGDTALQSLRNIINKYELYKDLDAAWHEIFYVWCVSHSGDRPVNEQTEKYLENGDRIFELLNDFAKSVGVNYTDDRKEELNKIINENKIEPIPLWQKKIL